MNRHEYLREYRRIQGLVNKAQERLDLMEKHLAIYYWRETNREYTPIPSKTTVTEGTCSGICSCKEEKKAPEEAPTCGRICY